MRKLKFPTAQTILIIIAIIVALLTWLVPAGKYDSLAYNAKSNTLIKTSLEKTIELPALKNLQMAISINPLVFLIRIKNWNQSLKALQN